MAKVISSIRILFCQTNYGMALSMPAVNHNELRKVLHKYKNILNERESLKLVLTRSLDISKFKSWILQDKNR